MIQKKAIFIIPGFKHSPKNKAYKIIAKLLKKEGYWPIPIKILWRQTTISQNTKYFLKVYKKINTRKKYILGFSYGAMIAFIASTKVKATGIILCSLSPYFKEDLSKLNIDWTSSLMTQRYDDFFKLNCSDLAKQIKTKQVLMLYGQKEEKSLKNRVIEAFNQISSSHKYLIPIKEVQHNIADTRYLNKIHQAARELN